MKGVNRLVVVMLLIGQLVLFAPDAEGPRGVHATEVEDINEAALQKSIAERQARTTAARLTEEQRAAAQQDIEEKKQQIEELRDNIKDLQSEAEIAEAKRLIDLLEKDIALTSFDVADSLYAENPNNTVAAKDRQDAAEDLFDVGAGSKYSDSVVPDTVKELEKNRKSLANDVSNVIQDASTAVSAVEADPKVVAAKNDAQQAASNLGLPVPLGDRQPTTAQILTTNLSAKTPAEVDTNIAKIVKNKRDLRTIFDAAVEKIKEIVKNARADTTTTFSKIDAMEQAQRSFADKAQNAVKDAFDASLVAVKHTFDRISGKSFEPRQPEELYVAADSNNITSIRVGIKNAESETVRVLKNYNQAKSEFDELSKRLYDSTIPVLQRDLSGNRSLAERIQQATSIKESLAEKKADLIAARDLSNAAKDKLEKFTAALDQQSEYLTEMNRYRYKPKDFKDLKSYLEYTSLEMFGKRTGFLKDFFGTLDPIPANVEKAYVANRDTAQRREYYVRKKADGTLMNISELSDFKSTPAYQEKLAAYDAFTKDTAQFNTFIAEFDNNRQKLIRSEFDQMYTAFKKPFDLKTMVLYERGEYPEISEKDFKANLGLIENVSVQINALKSDLRDMEFLNAEIDDAIERIDSFTAWIDAGTWKNKPTEVISLAQIPDYAQLSSKFPSYKQQLQAFKTSTDVQTAEGIETDLNDVSASLTTLEKILEQYGKQNQIELVGVSLEENIQLIRGNNDYMAMPGYKALVDAYDLLKQRENQLEFDKITAQLSAERARSDKDEEAIASLEKRQLEEAQALHKAGIGSTASEAVFSKGLSGK